MAQPSISNPVSELPTGHLRRVLAIGLAALLALFFFATWQSIQLLTAFRTTSRQIETAMQVRSTQLSSARFFLVLSQQQLRDYLETKEADSARRHKVAYESSWGQAKAQLAAFAPGSDGQRAAMARIHAALDQHQSAANPALGWSERQRRSEGSRYYLVEIEPKTEVFRQIASELGQADVDQARTALQTIDAEFDHTAARLSRTLLLLLAAVVLLSGATLIYVFRIEAEKRRRFQEVVDARQALQVLSARLVSAQEQERRAISRELHDEVGQTLSALLMDAGALAQRIPPADSASHQMLDNIKRLASESVGSIRDIALLLRPSMLDDLGLVPALEWQAKEFARRNSFKVRVTEEHVPDDLPDPVRTCIYRVTQEALQNASKHSGAKNVEVRVRASNRRVDLEIHDDGKGFDPATTRGVGLLGMEERVKQLGGRFSVDSSPTAGTTLRVEVPMTA